MYDERSPINTGALSGYPLGCTFSLYKHWLLLCLLAHSVFLASMHPVSTQRCFFKPLTSNTWLKLQMIHFPLPSFCMQISSAPSPPSPLRWRSCTNDGGSKKKICANFDLLPCIRQRSLRKKFGFPQWWQAPWKIKHRLVGASLQIPAYHSTTLYPLLESVSFMRDVCGNFVPLKSIWCAVSCIWEVAGADKGVLCPVCKEYLAFIQVKGGKVRRTKALPSPKSSPLSF